MIAILRVICVLLIIIAITLVLAPIQFGLMRASAPVNSYIPRFWHRIACRLLGFRIHVHGNMETKRPLLIAANHASWSDILILGAISDVVFVAKSEVKEWPVFGILARLQRTVFVQRAERRSVGDQVKDVSDRLVAGEAVVLFPEGTTSNGNRLLEIKSSLFGAAVKALEDSPQGVVHVQPVALAYTRMHGMPMGHYHRPIAAWPGDIGLGEHLLGVLKEGAIDIEVSFGQTINFTESMHRKKLAKEVEEQLRTMLGAHLRGRVAK